MKFNAKFLEDMYYEDNPDTVKVESEIVDQDRWTTQMWVIFSVKDKYYGVCIRAGSTEYQETEFYDEDCDELHRVEKLVKVWEKV